MMGGEGHEPVDHEVMGPYQKNQHIDWENPKHENQYRVGIIAKINVRCGSGFFGMPLGSHTRCQLHNAGHHISELVGNNCRDKN